MPPSSLLPLFIPKEKSLKDVAKARLILAQSAGVALTFHLQVEDLELIYTELLLCIPKESF